MFSCAVFSIVSGFTIISLGKRGLVALLTCLLISYDCYYFYLPRGAVVGLKCVIVAFPGHLLGINSANLMIHIQNGKQ